MKNLKLLLSLLTVPVSVHGEVPLRDFIREHPKPPFGAIVDFLHEHRRDNSLCNLIKYKLTITRTPKTSPDLWLKIIGFFGHIMDLAKRSQDNDSDLFWLDALGSPIKDTILLGQNRGIHGAFNIQCTHNLDSLTLKLTVYHDQEYDYDSWISEIKTAINFANQCKKFMKNKDFSLSERLGHPFKKILATKNIDSNVKVTFKDETNNKIWLKFSRKK